MHRRGCRAVGMYIVWCGWYCMWCGWTAVGREHLAGVKGMNRLNLKMVRSAVCPVVFVLPMYDMLSIISMLGYLIKFISSTATIPRYVFLTSLWDRVVHHTMEIFQLCHNHLHKFRSVLYHVCNMQCKSGADWNIFRGRSKSLNFAQVSGSVEIVQKAGCN